MRLSLNWLILILYISITIWANNSDNNQMYFRYWYIFDKFKIWTTNHWLSWRLRLISLCNNISNKKHNGNFKSRNLNKMLCWISQVIEIKLNRIHLTLGTVGLEIWWQGMKCIRLEIKKNKIFSIQNRGNHNPILQVCSKTKNIVFL